MALLALICCALAGGPAEAEKRVALVIGNGAYVKVGRLSNPARDAAAVEALLRTAGFDAVEVKTDLGAAAMRRALRDFSDRVAGADIAVVFYAGHGIEVNGINYLIPVDATLERDIDVEDETIPLERVTQIIDGAKRLRLVLLDACRDNPFVRTMKRSGRSVGRGLARVDVVTSDTLIAFAARHGSTAADGGSTNSPYTAALIKHLPTPGLDLRLALGRVRDEVLKSTGNRQEPFVYGSLGGAEIALVPALRPPPSPPVPLTAADRMWEAVKDTTNIAALEAFRERFGKDNPVYDRLAQGRIEELTRQRLALLKAEEEKKRDPALSVRPGSGASFRDRTADGAPCPECPEMVVVPAGSFTMGSPPGEAGRSDAEGPQHRVTIARPFAVGKFEVTFAEWDACLAAGGCKHNPGDSGWGRGKHPVINVSWNDITQEYLPWLLRKTGKTYRLLTEAEWEYVARAGTTTPFWWGTSISTSQANYDGNNTYGGAPKGEYRQKTLPVDSFAANPWGLHNVHGNVWEWVQDCWNVNYNGAPLDGSAWTTGDCSRRVLRGGSWFNFPQNLRAAGRLGNPPDYRDDYFGFRVGRTL